MAQQKGDKQGQGNWEQDLEDLGRAVGSEVRSLVNELGRTLGPAVRDVSAGVGEGLRGAAQGLGQAAQEFSKAARQTVRTTTNPYVEERKKKKFFKKLRESYEGLKWTAFGLGLTAFIMVAVSVMVWLDGDPDFLTLLPMAVAFAIPAGICKAKSYPALRLVNYHQLLDGRSYCTIEELAAAVDLPVYKVLKEVRANLREGKFEGMYLAPDGSRLFTNRTAYMAYCAAQDARSQTQEEETRPEAQAQEAPEAGGRTVTDELRTFFLGLREEKKRITDPAVLDQVENLDASTAQLIAWLETHPESEKKVKRFAAYYLPTTLKLLHTYNEVDAQADSSSVAAEIQRDITGILDTICTAFGTLRDGLLQDTALDVSAEISALETVLCQDGLAGDEGLQAK